jgi:hypothetical protein
VKSRLWACVFFLALFLVLAWITGATRSWHVVHWELVVFVVVVGGAWIVYNVVDGFRELRQRRRGSD